MARPINYDKTDLDLLYEIAFKIGNSEAESSYHDQVLRIATSPFDGSPNQQTSQVETLQERYNLIFGFWRELHLTFASQENAILEFKCALYRWHSDCCTLDVFIQEVERIFRGHRDLIIYFNRFLPPEHEINV